MNFLARNSRTHLAQGHCHGGEFTCQARVRVFSSEQIPITLSVLEITLFIHVCPCAMNYVHICICPLRFWLPTSWVILHIFSPFFEPPMPLAAVKPMTVQVSNCRFLGLNKLRHRLLHFPALTDVPVYSITLCHAQRAIRTSVRHLMNLK
jgi:hypothetical protein